MRLFLCGLPKIGKSTCGELLAKELGWTFIDIDIVIENSMHLSCRDIYQKLGGAYFRQLEAEAIQGTKNEDFAVISLGGGALELPANRNVIDELGYLIYLRGSTESVWPRIIHSGTPAYLDSDASKESLNRLSALRVKYFEEASDLSVDVDEKEPREVIATLLKNLPEEIIQAKGSIHG